MKKLNFLKSTLTGVCLSVLTVSAQEYVKPNFINTDFNTGDVVYTLNEGSAAGEVAGWNKSWNWAGGTLEYDGLNLIANAIDASFDNYPCLGTIITTPQVKLNTKDYPFLAVKFANMPATKPGGMNNDGVPRFIKGGVRVQLITRAATSSTGNNQDFYYMIDPTGVDDADFCIHTMEMSGDFEEVYLFNLPKGPERFGNASIYVPEREDLIVDILLCVIDAEDNTQEMKIDYIKSFESEAAFNLWSANKGSSGISNNTLSSLSVSSNNGVILVNGYENGNVELYDVAGKLIASKGTSSSAEFAAGTGIYLVKVMTEAGSKTVKVANK